MTPGSVLILTLGLVLLVSGVKNRSIMNTLLGKQDEESTGRGTYGEVNPSNTTPDDSAHSNASSSGVALSGYVTFDGHIIAAWIKPVLQWARANGWKGHVLSGYRTRAQQAEACAHTTGPCAEPGKSEHQSVIYPGGAVDVDDWQTLGRLVPHYPGPGPTLIQAVFANDPGHFSGNGH